MYTYMCTLQIVWCKLNYYTYILETAKQSQKKSENGTNSF